MSSAPKRINWKKRCLAALQIIEDGGTVDGAHHKMWTLDKAVRALTGTPEAYAEWVKNHDNGDEGPNTYSWKEHLPNW